MTFETDSQSNDVMPLACHALLLVRCSVDEDDGRCNREQAVV